MIVAKKNKTHILTRPENQKNSFSKETSAAHVSNMYFLTDED